MDNSLSKYHVDRYVDGRMGENRDKRKEYYIRLCLADSVLLNVLGEDSTKKLVQQVGKLVPVKISSK
jgi:hypothetical protein